jgi:hypothetical protein
MKVYIHPHVTGEVRKKLEDLLNEIGCEIVDNVDDCDLALDAHLEEGEDCNEDGQLVAPACVVVLTPGLTEEDLQPGLTQAVAHGCRVIGIWGPGADGDMSSLDDYGSDTVPWEKERIHDAICGKPQHLDPSGAATRRRKADTGGCGR